MTEAFHKSAEPQDVEKLLRPLMEIPAMKQAYEERYWYQVPSLEELRGFPEGSFGRAAAEFFDRWGLDLDFYPEPDLSTPESYVTSRVYQAHDFWHVLTGYDPSLEGELAVQAFAVGQNTLPIAVVIVGGGLVNFIQNSPERAMEIMTIVTEAFQRGKAAKNFLAVPILERLAEPLENVRRDLGIKPRGAL